MKTPFTEQKHCRLSFFTRIEPHLEPKQSKSVCLIVLKYEEPRVRARKNTLFLKLGKEIFLRNKPEPSIKQRYTHKLLQKRTTRRKLRITTQRPSISNHIYNPIDRASRSHINHYNKHSTQQRHYSIKRKALLYDKMIAHGIRGFAGFTLNTHGDCLS